MGIGKHLNLILELTSKEIKVKYNSSYFGYIWMILNPLLMLVSLYVVFSVIVKLNLPYYQIFLLLGIIVWNFFSEATMNSINSLNGNLSLLKKVKLPLYQLIISSNLAALLNFFVSIIILLAIMLFFNIKIFTFIRVFSLIPILLLVLFTLSVSFIVCILYLYFKDMVHIWTFVIFVGFWLTPIIYPESFIPEQYIRYYMLNPLARIISSLRNTILYNYLDSSTQIIITVFITLVLLCFSLLFYEKLHKKIYDIL